MLHHTPFLTLIILITFYSNLQPFSCAFFTFPDFNRLHYTLPKITSMAHYNTPYYIFSLIKLSDQSTFIIIPSSINSHCIVYSVDALSHYLHFLIFHSKNIYVPYLQHPHLKNTLKITIYPSLTTYIHWTIANARVSS